GRFLLGAESPNVSLTRTPPVAPKIVAESTRSRLTPQSGVWPAWRARTIKKGRSMLRVIHERCAGLDIHKKTVVACILVNEQDGQVREEKRTFGTTTGQILALAEWLKQEQVSSVAMESTGVYWVPVYNLLEAGTPELLVVNAQHMKERYLGARLTCATPNGLRNYTD